MILVRATKTGYYNHHRNAEGRIFKLKKKEDFSANWMEVMIGKKPVRFNSKEEFLSQYDSLVKESTTKKPVEEYEPEVEEETEIIDNDMVSDNDEVI